MCIPSQSTIVLLCYLFISFIYLFCNSDINLVFVTISFLSLYFLVILCICLYLAMFISYYIFLKCR